jgi:hypothetical protein
MNYLLKQEQQELLLLLLLLLLHYHRHYTVSIITANQKLFQSKLTKFYEMPDGKANISTVADCDRSVIPVTSLPGTLRQGCMNSIWFRCVVIAIWELDSDNIYLSLTHLPTLQTRTTDSYCKRLPGASSLAARGGLG